MIYGFVHQSERLCDDREHALGRGTVMEICLPRFTGEIVAAKDDEANSNYLPPEQGEVVTGR